MKNSTGIIEELFKNFQGGGIDNYRTLTLVHEFCTLQPMLAEVVASLSPVSQSSTDRQQVLHNAEALLDSPCISPASLHRGEGLTANDTAFCHTLSCQHIVMFGFFSECVNVVYLTGFL